MPEPLFTKKIAASNIPFKFAKFHQSLLRFGLPWAGLFIALDYGSFLATSGHGRMHYPWLSTLILLVPSVLGASAVWWLIMREIAAWKRKNQL